MVRNILMFFLNIFRYFQSKSLRWRIMLSIFVSIFILMITLLAVYRVEYYSVKIIGSAYKSNMELTSFTDSLNLTEKALENYINFHTFDSIDSYYSYRNKVSEYMEKMQMRPSQDLVQQKEYLVSQFTQNFLLNSGRAIHARRANDFNSLNYYYNRTISCYNMLMNQLSEFNSLLLQQNAMNYTHNLEQMNSLYKLSFLLFLTISSIIVTVMYFSVSQIVRPLKQISSVAHKISQRDFNVPLFYAKRHDEIGNICDAFDRMIISIREYIDAIWEKAVTEAELKEKEVEMQALYADAQLRALQNQINPHFLFNTLNTGAQLAMMEGADKTCFFIEQTADFFRYNIQQKNKTVSIDEELKLVDNFVYIMSVRFGNRLQFEKQLPEGDYENQFTEQIPVMTLQPLVENCIKHGLKNSIGRVVLNIQRFEKFIQISVSDNGSGFPAQIRDNIFAAIQNSDKDGLQNVLVSLDSNAVKKDEGGNGTGLINVFMRLKLYFHRNDVFDITENDDGKGTKFIIRIPVNV
ncbi:MAG: histidine kinase [Treponema sp.]|nr:histidine kinase [Treponema sp.]